MKHLPEGGRAGARPSLARARDESWSRRWVVDSTKVRRECARARSNDGSSRQAFAFAGGDGVLAGYARVFGWVAAAWLLGIAMNLLASGRFLDVAARDVALAVAAGALAKLAPLYERAVALSPTGAEPALSRT